MTYQSGTSNDNFSSSVRFCLHELSAGRLSRNDFCHFSPSLSFGSFRKYFPSHFFFFSCLVVSPETFLDGMATVISVIKRRTARDVPLV